MNLFLQQNNKFSGQNSALICNDDNDDDDDDDNDNDDDDSVVSLDVVSSRWQVLLGESELLAFDRCNNRLSESLRVLFVNYCLSTQYTH